MLVCDIKDQTIKIHNERIVITKATIDLTIQWYANNSQGCIDEILNGEVTVNNIEKYIEDKKQEKSLYLSGNFKPWLGFWQRALYIQTNKSISIL